MTLLGQQKPPAPTTTNNHLTGEMKSLTWRWIVPCAAVPCVVGYYVMQATNSRNQHLESELRRIALPDTIKNLLGESFKRSSLAPQEIVSKVLRKNDRPGIYCSQVHIGRDGTTLSFQLLPASVGSAGPIKAAPQEQFNNIAGGTLPTITKGNLQKHPHTK